MNALEIIPQLIRASVEKDDKTVEVISLTMANILRKKTPAIAEEIEQILFNKNIGNNAYRSIGLSDIPKDRKSEERLLNVREPSDLVPPVLSDENSEKLNQFIIEQDKKFDLLKLGLKPVNSLLLFGEPGVGKTYSANWLASILKKPLITLDLATIMSSYLGETGNNIKKILDYAKENNCVLFLDEFDAIAKTRTDGQELGEIKRIVNVLLKELEEWPVNSIVIAATNHEELLDKAIWRRFDLKVHLNMPDYLAIYQVIEREFSQFDYLNYDILKLLGRVLEGLNCAEVVRTCTEIKRAHVLYEKPIDELIVEKCSKYIVNCNKQEKVKIVQQLHDMKINVNKIAALTGIPTSTIYKYINN